jgi:hypothetical protein
MASHQDPICTPIEEDSTLGQTFLGQEIFIANTFASTTNFLDFSTNEEPTLDSSVSKPSSLFIEIPKLP